MAPPEQGTSEKVVRYAKTKVGQVVDRGECWDLPFFALKNSNAKTPHDLGTDLYVWGTVIPNIRDAKPGDILQFSNVRIHREWREGNMTKWQDFNFGVRHSAVVESVEGAFITTLNAHINGKKKVTRLVLNLSPENITQGTVTLYRPIAKQ
jgi:hypothetical protein